jgi:hypothetical protein
MARAPLGVIVKDSAGPGASKPLGVWPFGDKYTMHDNPIARLGGIRKSTLPHLQRMENQNVETQRAKATNTPANLQSHDVRFRNLQDAIKTRDDLLGRRNKLALEQQDRFESLKPFDAPKTSHEIALQAEYRSVLRSADSKAQAELLKQVEFRQAAMADGAHPSLSGIAPTQFARMRQARIAQRYPDETQMNADFQAADEIVGNHLSALDAMIETERRALGIPAVERATKPAEDWE